MKVARGLIGLCAAGVLLIAGSAKAAILFDVTDGTPNDAAHIVGVFNTGAGGPNHLSTVGSGNGQYPAAEAPFGAIDGSSSTKYLNFGKLSVGLAVSPIVGGTIVTGLHVVTANDAPERDPLTFTLEGSNDPNALADGNASWTFIAAGLTQLDTDPGRSNAGAPTTNFANAQTYSSYRLLFTSLRNSITANSMQIGDVELIGQTVPEPASLSVLALSGLMLIRRRRA